MLTLDPSNSHALLLRGRNLFDSGDMAGAIQNLEKLRTSTAIPTDCVRSCKPISDARLPEAEHWQPIVHRSQRHGAITGSPTRSWQRTARRGAKGLSAICDRLVATDSGKVSKACMR